MSNLKFVCHMSPGAAVMASRLGIETIGDLARLDADDIESLRRSSMAAKELIERVPTVSTQDLEPSELKRSA